VNRDASRRWTADLYRRCLPREPDAYATFLDLAATLCPPGGTVIDLGCGEEGYLSCLLEKATEVIGLDHRQLQGPYSRYLQADLDRDIPLEAESVDLAACKFLVEHLETPASFLRQVHGSLRRGGHLVIMTPNILYYPYTLNYVLSRLMTQERRMRMVEAFSGRAQQEIFPVHYRCNTPHRLRRELTKAGYDVVHLRTYSDYSVSAVTRPLGALAVAYELAAGFAHIESARGFIVAAAVRK
jgi:SAM-dependent methyltransferase